MPTIADGEGVLCPSCGASDAVPILYGLPDAEGFRAAEAGQVILGGCSLTSSSLSRSQATSSVAGPAGS